MKKLISILLLIAVLSISCNASAEMLDFSAMSFEELQAMKTAVDKEYNARPESEGTTLVSGKYYVGRDIKPGLYFIAMVHPSSSYGASFALYENAEILSKEEPGYSKLAKENEYMPLSGDPKSLSLEEQNVLCIDGGPVLLKASVFDPKEYYSYEPPAGTFVPEGNYTVGTEIPAGRYIIYPGTVKGGRYNAYGTITKEDGTTAKQTRNKNDWGSAIDISVVEPIHGDQIELFDGDIVEIGKSVIMQKAQDLNFE